MQDCIQAVVPVSVRPLLYAKARVDFSGEKGRPEYDEKGISWLATRTRSPLFSATTRLV